MDGDWLTSVLGWPSVGVRICRSRTVWLTGRMAQGNRLLETHGVKSTTQVHQGLGRFRIAGEQPQKYECQDSIVARQRTVGEPQVQGEKDAVPIGNSSGCTEVNAYSHSRAGDQRWGLATQIVASVWPGPWHNAFAKVQDPAGSILS